MRIIWEMSNETKFIPCARVPTIHEVRMIGACVPAFARPEHEEGTSNDIYGTPYSFHIRLLVSLYVSVQEIKPTLWVHTSHHYESKTDAKRYKGAVHFQRTKNRIRRHREAVPLAILMSRVTTLAAPRSLLAVAVVPLVVAGAEPVRAW